MSSPLGSALCYAVAILVCLWAFAANGGAFFYFDSGAYVERGLQILEQIGLVSADQVGPTEGDAASMPAPGDGPRTVDGSRSAVYSLMVGLFVWAGALEGLIVLNAVLVVVSIWLPVRVAFRTFAPDRSPALLTLAAVLLASLGSLSFYVAYLMADILAAILIVMVATLVAFGGRMKVWEILLAFVLGALGVIVHLSHLAIALVLLPVVIVLALLVREPRRWLAPMALVGLIGLGFSEQFAFRVAADVTQHAEVVYRPFITARLIQDGPGLEFLDEHCPDEAIPTCALHEALSWSDNPWRLTASHIIFERSPELGSFQLMSGEDQRDVAKDQIDFFLQVLRDRPLDVALVAIENTFLQATMNSVDMTLQSDAMITRNGGLPGLALGGFRDGRLTASKGWLAVADPLQSALYALSALLLVVAVISSRTPGMVKVFLVMLAFGILANAFVCGALSQPATRYGARVIWLLPAAAAIAGSFLLRRTAASRPDPLDVLVSRGQGSAP